MKEVQKAIFDAIDDAEERKEDIQEEISKGLHSMKEWQDNVRDNMALLKEVDNEIARLNMSLSSLKKKTYKRKE